MIGRCWIGGKRDADEEVGKTYLRSRSLCGLRWCAVTQTSRPTQPAPARANLSFNPNQLDPKPTRRHHQCPRTSASSGSSRPRPYSTCLPSARISLVSVGSGSSGSAPAAPSLRSSPPAAERDARAGAGGCSLFVCRAAVG